MSPVAELWSTFLNAYSSHTTFHDQMFSEPPRFYSIASVSELLTQQNESQAQ